jgi:hypothetical protein
MRKWAVVLVGCAWVLWSFGLNNTGWNPSEGFDTKAECAAGLERQLNVFRGRDDARVEGTLVLTKKSTTDNVWTASHYTCLPDTIDPRDKK